MAHSTRATSKPAPHGRVVGRYLMYGQIGSGGTATVHFGRLRGQGGFTRTVALKRLHAHLARDPYFASLFMSEARLGARVSHPNVASLLDVVRLGDGELLLVMDYVHGETLAGLLALCRRREDPIPLRIANAIVIGALRGLHAAHEALGENGRPLGLVHGDVSPHNVIVGADGTTRMLDFGVARAGVANGADCRVIGTLAYMAPERLNGANFDRRSDVFSAGVLLYEMLAMRRLFTGSDGRSRRGLAQIAAPSSHRPEIPKPLDYVVMQALRPPPEARPQSAGDFARALEQALPPATCQEVADWLNVTAGARLRERAEELSRIERSSAPSLVQEGEFDGQDDQPTTAVRTPVMNPLRTRTPALPPADRAEDDPTLFDINPAFREEPQAARATSAPGSYNPPAAAPQMLLARRPRRTLTPELSPLPGSHDSQSPTPPPPRATDEYPSTQTRPKLAGRWLIVGSVCVALWSAGAWQLGRATAGKMTPAPATAAAAPAPALARVAPIAAPTPAPAPTIAVAPAVAAVAEIPTAPAVAAPVAPPTAPAASVAAVAEAAEAEEEGSQDPSSLAVAADVPESEAPTEAPTAVAPRRSIRDRVTALNQRALAAYERLDPGEALRLLNFGLRLCPRAGQDTKELTARTHVNLGVVLAGGFKQRGLASRHFRVARSLNPAIKPTRDMSNPEIEAALRESGAYLRPGY
jgi:eukaryotic-like serine/threonine-protein kinase